MAERPVPRRDGTPAEVAKIVTAGAAGVVTFGLVGYLGLASGGTDGAPPPSVPATAERVPTLPGPDPTQPTSTAPGPTTAAPLATSLPPVPATLAPVPAPPVVVTAPPVVDIITEQSQ